MPVCTRDGLDAKPEAKKEEKFHDDEKVFYLQATKEIFRNYEDYFQRVMLINSTVWACSITGKEGLTYEEALSCEKRARDNLEGMKESLKGIVLLVIEKLLPTMYTDAANIAFQFIRDRFFLHEIIDHRYKTTFVPFEVVDIIKPKETPSDGVYDPETLVYKLKNTKDLKILTDADKTNMRRARSAFSMDKVKYFLKKHTFERPDGYIVPKKESYKQMVTDHNLSFEKIFIGKMPEWKRRVPKKEVLEKKQATMAKYLVKRNNELTEAEKAAQLAREEQQIRLQKERDEKRLAAERLRIERLAKVDEEYRRIRKKCDDLEREDQKPLPMFKAVETLISKKHFSDFLVIQEFMHTFSPILASHDVFRSNVTYFQMCRAFLNREVAGPLSDILQVLLSTIFTLQVEEHQECAVDHPNRAIALLNPIDHAIKTAGNTHRHIKSFFSCKIYELPLDAQTISEILRLHFLSSGGLTDEKSEKWRFQWRNGYVYQTDPGLHLRMQKPHILRQLSMYTVYQLNFTDILYVIKTLIDQILTHYGTISLIEERHDEASKARIELRQISGAENKRQERLKTLKRKIAGEFRIKQAEVKDNEDAKKALEDQMNKELTKLDQDDAAERRKFSNNIERVKNTIFKHTVLLGQDRAYRKYYIFKSMKGIFVEHPSDSYDTCLSNPPKNSAALAFCEEDKRKKKLIISQMFNFVDKENRDVTNKDTKTVKPATIANGTLDFIAQVKVNGTHTNHIEELKENEKEIKDLPAYDLFMCTGDPKNCIVHDPKCNDRVKWSFLYAEEEVNELIDALNPRGEREGALREQLIALKKLIIFHVRRCPEWLFSIETSGRDKYLGQVYAETHLKYNDPNFGLPEKSDINDVMYSSLVRQILQLENEITAGDLGKMFIKDLSKWREDILHDKYDPQIPLEYGINESDTDQQKHSDPGIFCALGDTPLDIDTEASSEEEISLTNSPTLLKRIHDLASALLQVEQAISQKFLRKPFGLEKDVNDKKEAEALLLKGDGKRKQWEVSLMASTSFSQVFLHLNILNDAIKWDRSTFKSNCIICRRKGDPEKMLLCDECNAGSHMYCLVPPLKKVPEGNWYCKRCAPKMQPPEPKTQRRKRRAIFTMDEEETPVDDNIAVVVENEEDSQTDDDEWTIDKLKSKNSKGQKGKKSKKKRKKEAELEEIEFFNLDDYDEDELDDEACEGEEIDETGVDDNDEGEDDDDIDDGEPDEEVEDEDDDEQEVFKPNKGKNSSSKKMSKSKKVEDNSCKVCDFNGADMSCGSCRTWYHFECTALKRQPRGNWQCSKCKAKEYRKKKLEDKGDSSSDDSDEPLIKRLRRSAGGSAAPTENGSKNNNNAASRRARRTNEYLPLNTVVLYDLLNKITRHPDSWPFLRPVTLSEVPDYHDIIKNPMDFARIKSNLNMGRYTTTEEVLSDIQLVFRNCDLYNAEGNDVYCAGQSLEKSIQKRCEELGLPFMPSDMVANSL